MVSRLEEDLDSRFFQIVRGHLIDAHVNIADTFDVQRGLSKDELFFGENVKSLDYLFSAIALAVSSKNSAGLIHPVIATPSTGLNSVYDFLQSRLVHYSKQEPAVKFSAIDCKSLIGQTRLGDDDEKIEIPRLIKWRMENEETNLGTKLFLLNNASAIVSSNGLTFKEVISEMKSISETASFVAFLSPSAYQYVSSNLTEEDELPFSRPILFDGFSVTDLKAFKKIIEDRLKRESSLSGISIDDVGLEVALVSSRGVPYYAFKIISESIKSALFDDTKNVTASRITQIKNEMMLDSMWQNIDELTEGQIAILTALTSFPENSATVYQIRDKLRSFRKPVGDRSAILQQLRKLYQNNLLDREKPSNSLQVFYKLRQTVSPAFEERVKNTLKSVR